MAYFSNSCEGDMLDNQCADCVVGRHADASCPVLLVQLTYNYKQFKKNGERGIISEVLNCLVNEGGVCQMKRVLDDYVRSGKESDPELFYNEPLVAVAGGLTTKDTKG